MLVTTTRGRSGKSKTLPKDKAGIYYTLVSSNSYSKCLGKRHGIGLQYIAAVLVFEALVLRMARCKPQGLHNKQ